MYEQWETYPRSNDNRLESVKDRFDSNGSIHATEVENRVGDGGRAVIKRFHDEGETY
jgi:hypothetical protein